LKDLDIVNRLHVFEAWKTSQIEERIQYLSHFFAGINKIKKKKWRENLSSQDYQLITKSKKELWYVWYEYKSSRTYQNTVNFILFYSIYKPIRIKSLSSSFTVTNFNFEIRTSGFTFISSWSFLSANTDSFLLLFISFACLTLSSMFN